MSTSRILLNPRHEPPAPGLAGGVRPGLPDVVVADQLRRLAAMSGVGIALWTYGLVMDTLVRPLTLGAPAVFGGAVMEVLAIVASLAMHLYVRYAPQRYTRKSDAGLVYLVLNAIAVACLNDWTHPIVAGSRGQLSWNTIVILVASITMPAAPGKMLAASIAAATTDPIVALFPRVHGLPAPSLLQALVLFMPNYACALLSILPAQLLYRLGGRLREAQELGSYHLLELLGRGGMGEVWRARHRFLSRPAAIKLVRPELLGAGSDAEAQAMLRRFEREAQATASLSSPHTVRLFDFGLTADRSFYYVMELLDGRDLKSVVSEFGPMPAERVVFLLEQVCHSLADAHARGLVHRDVTPSNLYLCRMGLDFDFIKVLDFGLVTSSERSLADQTLMATQQTTTGTPAFMAPEVIVEGNADARADVYALGCVAYYLLTGQLVFEADTAIKMFLQHVQAEPIPPSQRSELPIPAAVDQLVLRCLAKNPADRPRNAAELLTLVRALPTGWTSDRARAWWEHHFVELSGPLPAAA